MSKNIKYMMCRELEEKVKLGTKKRAEERKSGAENRSPYIHSGSTARAYFQQVRDYGDWLRDNGYNHATMDDARAQAGRYVKSLLKDGKSAWTANTARSALAKTFGVKASTICSVPARKATEIKRGRVQKERAAAIERNHADLAEICRSTGLRSHRELAGLTADNLNYDSNGNVVSVTVKGKGGRVRTTTIMGSKGGDLLKSAAQANPTGSIVHIPSHANVHGWRADYAARCYQQAVQTGKCNGKTYTARATGVKYDKGALAWVSEQLGHGADRYYTVVNNYLSYGNADA